MTTSDAHELIIYAHHALSRWQRWLSWSLTLLCWLMWLSLWWPALVYVFQGAWVGMPAWNSLRSYVWVSAWVGVSLVVWARVNYWHFSSHEQRQGVPDVTADELAADLGVAASALQGGRLAQVMVVHHLPAGGIESIESASHASVTARLALTH